VDVSIGGCAERLTGTNMEIDKTQTEKNMMQSAKSLLILQFPS
jgi:hypothetical protein